MSSLCLFSFLDLTPVWNGHYELESKQGVKNKNHTCGYSENLWTGLHIMIETLFTNAQLFLTLREIRVNLTLV